MKLIPLTQGKFAQVDDEDYFLVNSLKWCAKRNRDLFYAVSRIKKNGKNTTVYMHRFIINPIGKNVIDHIDHDTLNNQKTNLRECISAENLRNKKSLTCNEGSKFVAHRKQRVKE